MLIHRHHSLRFLFLIGLLVSCNATDIQVELGEQFTLYPGEDARVPGTRFRLRLHSVGLEWDGDEEFAFAMLTANQNDEQYQLAVGDEIVIDSYVIHLHGIDIFGGDSSQLTITKEVLE